MPDLSHYRKLVTALVGAVVAIAVQLGWDNVSDWVVSLIPLLTAAGVYQIPNEPL